MNLRILAERAVSKTIYLDTAMGKPP